MRFRINTPWDQRKHARAAKENAGHEVEVSQQRYDETNDKTLKYLNTLRKQNHFAELLAESLAEGYNRK